MVEKKKVACPLFLLLSALLFFTYSLHGKSQNIIITNFINESGYRGEWDIENEFPKMISGILIRKKQEIPIWRKRHWRDESSDLRRKFPDDIVISGRITEFSYNTNSTDVFVISYKTTRAKVEIILEIIKEGEVYTENCTGEEVKKDFDVNLFKLTEPETEVDELAGIKFGDSVFETTLPGKATKKAIGQCIAMIEKYLDNK